METKFNFKSQICTDRSQSERLLALGLRRETADMIYECNVQYPYDYDLPPRSLYEGEGYITGVEHADIPAWSLHRLWDILPEDVEVDDDCYVTSHLEGKKAIVYHDYGCNYYNFDKKNIYDNIIDCIEWLIKEGYFNKEYLV